MGKLTQTRDYARLERILEICNKLADLPPNGSLKVIDLAKEFGVSRQTVYRDRDFISGMGIPLCEDIGKGLRVAPGLKFNIKSAFTREELLAIMFLIKMAEKQSDYPYKKEIGSIRKKLLNPKFHCEFINSGINRLEMYMDNYSPLEPQIFRLLEHAIEEKKIITMDYYSPLRNKIESRKFNPYRIFFRKNAWYTAGFCYNHKEVRTFNIVRIKKIELTNRKYEIPEDFSLENYLKDSWEIIRYGNTKVDVKVRFTGIAANIVKDLKRHPSQKIEELEDGSIIYSVTLEDWEEFAFWIAGYGAHAEVLEPHDFREYMVEKARCILRVYEEKL